MAALPQAGPARLNGSGRSRAGRRTRPPGISGAFAAEWRRVLADRGVFTLFLLGPVLYGFFYPQPYLGQIVRDIPIAVVDRDNTELSGGLIQTLGAHGNISVALRVSTFRKAQDAILSRRACGILGIPSGTERDFLKGVAARLPVYADSTYFILFNRALQGLLESVQAYQSEVVSQGARTTGTVAQTAMRLTQPVELVQVPLFNPTASYSSYAMGLAGPVSARVAEQRNWGEFATWRAARATGDLNMFFVRLDPVSTVPALAPGQTVWLDGPRRSD